ncbi:MAG: hypothetical protein KDA91_17275 [Planctomycetaceae bacterium]|nr:hypothetical protein [Planctomycetaceae bacterium]
MGRQIDWGKRREWEQRLARRESSGLTVAEFCEWEGVSVAAFYQWRKKFSSKSESRHWPPHDVTSTSCDGDTLRSPLTGRAAFLPVHLTASRTGSDSKTGDSRTGGDSRGPAWTAAASLHLEVQLPNDVRIIVPMSDINTLRDVLIAASEISSVQEDARC